MLVIDREIASMADVEEESVCLTYKYRLLLSRNQHMALEDICESQRVLYNAALEHRIGAWQKASKTITLYSQMAELTELRQDPEYSAIPANVQRWTLKRLDDAYQAFFRRVKVKGERAGFPRFRGKGRWNSFGFAEFCGIRLKGKRLHFKGIAGSLRLHLHRPLPEGKPLSCTFTRDHKGWNIGLQYRVAIAPLPKTNRQVGADVGLTHLATLSTGVHIPNPRIARRAEREVRRRQRALARCNIGSKRRSKVKSALTRCNAKIKNARRTYLHQVSVRMVRENDLIAVEKLNVKGLAAGMLAKSVNDAAWSKFKEMLTYKAAKAGRRLIEVKAAGTSRTCPSCGQVKAKTLAERVHSCECGCVMDRDHAAAIVILQRGVMVPHPANVAQWSVRSDRNIVLDAVLNESLPKPLQVKNKR